MGQARPLRGQQSITLGEKRGEIAALDEERKEHQRDCRECKPRHPCEERRRITAELAEAREEIKHWFDPGPDQGGLF